MPKVEITSMSTKGQVVIPAAMRKRMGLGDGSKLIALQVEDKILLTPVAEPDVKDFSDIIRLGDLARERYELIPDDIQNIVTTIRQEHARRP